MAKIAKSLLGLHTVYSCGCTISGGLRNIFSECECIEIAERKIKEDETIKYIEIYKIDWCEGESFGKRTTLSKLDGKNIRKDPFKDPEFLNWYNEISAEQD